jgi:hypothetical protein
MIRNKLAIAAVALVGALGAGLAQARDDVRFSVTIGAPAPVYATGPAYVAGPAYGYDTAPVRRVTPWDRDGDGIPNRYDRVYNPRSDRDGDGMRDRHEHIRHTRWDRDGDGIPNWRDPHPDRYDGRTGWQR